MKPFLFKFRVTEKGFFLESVEKLANQARHLQIWYVTIPSQTNILGQHYLAFIFNY